MQSWVRRQRDKIELTEPEADKLIHNLGVAPIPLLADANMKRLSRRYAQNGHARASRHFIRDGGGS
jgi:hypothetical protein